MDNRERWLRRWFACFVVIMVSNSSPLWFGTSELPQIPWLQVVVGTPAALDGILIIGAGLAVLGFAVFQQRQLVKWSARACLIYGGGLLLFDQQRLQPWVWQFFIVFAFFAFCHDSRSHTSDVLKWWRWLVASIYIFSGVSKLDAAFFDGIGHLLLQGLGQSIGLDIGTWSPQMRWFAIGLMPVGELTVGILLLLRATRNIGLWGSLAMHAMLLLTLGPWGLNHEPGVLLWNLYFIGQNLILFKGPGQIQKGAESSQALAPPTSPRPVSSRMADVCVLCILAFPILESIGWYDHWPAWAVYCARPARVKMFIDTAQVELLPQSLQRHVGPPLPLTTWAPVNLSGWSFAECRCPLYPQDRLQLAIALSVCEHSHIREEAVRIEISDTPDRWTGKREERQLQGLFEISLACEDFFWNMQRR